VRRQHARAAAAYAAPELRGGAILHITTLSKIDTNMTKISIYMNTLPKYPYMNTLKSAQLGVTLQSSWEAQPGAEKRHKLFADGPAGLAELNEQQSGFLCPRACVSICTFVLVN